MVGAAEAKVLVDVVLALLIAATTAAAAEATVISVV